MQCSKFLKIQSFQKVLRNLFLWMIINLAIFYHFFCELPQAKTLCGNYFFEFVANSLKKIALEYLFELRRINCAWISTSYIRSNAFFCTVKHLATDLESYILQVSPVKRARSGSPEYFDLIFHTAEERFRSVCYFSKRWDRINKFQQEDQSYIISSIIKTDESSAFKLTSNSTVKEKTLSFKMHNRKIYSSLVTITNEIQQ